MVRIKKLFLHFKGDYDQVVMCSIVNEEQEPLARYKSGVSDELQKIVDKALTKNVENRYQNVGDVSADLSALGQMVSAQRISWSLKSQGKKQSVLSLTTGLLFVLILASLPNRSTNFLGESEQTTTSENMDLG